MSVCEHHRLVFSVEPDVFVASPGRINLIGEHIDYLGGEVMPIAINRHLSFAASRIEDARLEIVTLGQGMSEPVLVEFEDLTRREGAEESWLNYIIGVVSLYREAGLDVPGFRVVIESNLPVGAGLSSSAALETGIALIIESLTGVEQDVVDRALICQQAEHQFAGVPCGIMDQIAVGAGRADSVVRLDCRDLSIEYVSIPDGIAILAADTGVKHALGDGEYAKRREDCDRALAILGEDSFRGLNEAVVEAKKHDLGDQLYRRARHAVSEMARVTHFASALAAGDRAQIGESMRSSHESLRLDYEVSCEELDALVEEAYRIGASRGMIGSRMTGGGFGGSTVSLVEADAAPAIRIELENFYREKFGRELNCFITSAVDGANSVSPPTPHLT